MAVQSDYQAAEKVSTPLKLLNKRTEGQLVSELLTLRGRKFIPLLLTDQMTASLHVTEVLSWWFKLALGRAELQQEDKAAVVTVAAEHETPTTLSA